MFLNVKNLCDFLVEVALVGLEMFPNALSSMLNLPFASALFLQAEGRVKSHLLHKLLLSCLAFYRLGVVHGETIESHLAAQALFHLW